MTNTRRSTSSSPKLKKHEVKYLISLIDKNMAPFEVEIEIEGDSVAEAKKMLRMLNRIRFAVIDLDK